MTRFSTSVDLAAFAPDTCPNGHRMALRSGNRAVSSFPCQCPGIKADPGKRLHHIKVACTVCGWACYDPPHEEDSHADDAAPATAN